MTARFRVLDPSSEDDRAAWIEAWEVSPGREVFAHPAYLELFSSTAARPRCAILASTQGTVMYPFLLRRVPAGSALGPSGHPAWDVSGPYGYGGAFWWGADREGLATEFWPAFGAWARAAGIVSEVVRLSLFEESILPHQGEVRDMRANVVVPLVDEVEAIWRRFAHKVRKNVNRANRSGVTVRKDSSAYGLNQFLEVYDSTMNRRAASEEYRFEFDCFSQLYRSLSGKFEIFNAYFAGRVVSSELVLVSNEYVYSFLGGTIAEYFGVRPNDLLKYEIIRWSKDIGKRYYVLGGGYEPDDGIFRYKLGFAPGHAVRFRVANRIWDEDRYRALVGSRAASDPAWVPRAGFFPEYRG